MKRVLLTGLISILCIGILCALVVAFVINPAAYSACEVRIRAAMFEELNAAALEGMGGVSYDDLFTIEKDPAGKILMIGANAPRINEIARTVAESAQQRTQARAEQGVEISLGTFSGIAFLGGAGGNIHFDVQPAGYVDVSFRSEFRSVGINQTLHRVVADFSSAFTLVMPLQERSVEVVTEMLVCETVIVGEVPDIYFENNGGSLNFVPSDS